MAGRALHHAVATAQRLTERDQALIRGHHPGEADGTYSAACRHADRWELPHPDEALRRHEAAAAIATVRRLRGIEPSSPARSAIGEAP